MDTVKKILSLMGKYKTYYFIAMIISVISSVLTMVSPIVFQITIDALQYKTEIMGTDLVSKIFNYFGGTQFLIHNLWFTGVFLLAVSCLVGLLAFTTTRLVSITSQSMTEELRNRMYSHIQRLPYDYHVKSQAGDLIQRCTSDVQTVRKFLAGQFLEILRTSIMLFFTINVMLSYSIKMTLISLFVFPIIITTAYIFFKKARTAFKSVDEKEGELGTVLSENLSGVRVVRAFGRQKFEIDKYEEKSFKLSELIKNMIRLHGVYWASTDFLCFLQLLVIIVCGIYFNYTGELDLGVVILFNTYVMMLLWPLRQSGRILADFGKMQVSLGRIYEILNTNEESQDLDLPSPSLVGDLEISNLSFNYTTEKDGNFDKDKSSKQILKNINLKVNSGETLAILGSTGSGKSTLLHLLLRLYDYETGCIKINGVEINKINKNHLRTKVGIVLQEPFLYSKTIKENILMANSSASENDIYDVAKIAAVHDVITNFTDGYNTLVGEKGITLSGGQRQRVAIARTLIKNSDILIFDDSLSAVDTDTDLQIREALNEKFKERSIISIIVSQRITTLMNADKIIVLEHGEITEMGTHDELIQNKGLYGRIWDIQSMLEESLMELEA